MAKKTDKTNAARLLDKAGISYKLIPYEFDENDLAAPPGTTTGAAPVLPTQAAPPRRSTTVRTSSSPSRKLLTLP